MSLRPEAMAGVGDDGDTESDHSGPPMLLTSVKQIGVSETQNAKFRQTMEDSHVFIDNFGEVPTQAFAAIYDGHGGRQGADLADEHLHMILLEELKNVTLNGDIDNDHKAVRTAFDKAYSRTDDILAKHEMVWTGTTAVTVLLRYVGDSKYLFCANAGDARAVLSTNNEATRISYDHTPKDEAEVTRITESGGFIRANRVSGILAVSRALGDHAFKDHVISEPFYSFHHLKPDDEHILILGCDGLWDVMTDEEAIGYIKTLGTAQEMADVLLYKALDLGSTDNISVVVVKV